MTRKRAWLAGRSLRPWSGLALALIAALAVFGVACDGDGDDEAAEVEDTIQAAIDAWNAKDVDGLLALVTDKFISEQLEGATREQAPDVLGEFIGENQETLIDVSEVDVSGDTATAIVDERQGNLLTRERSGFVREDGAWKFDTLEHLAVPIPDDVTAIDLELTEYEFNFDESAITSGNIAFNVSNAGEEQHVIDLAKIPEDLDIEQALRSEEEPPGVEFIGGTEEPLDPGDETTLAFAEPLEPGRYAMACFVEAADGEPHALKGMWAEFTVE